MNGQHRTIERIKYGIEWRGTLSDGQYELMARYRVEGEEREAHHTMKQLLRAFETKFGE